LYRPPSVRDGESETTLASMKKPAKPKAPKKPGKKRPCSVCGKWFIPDRRALERQRCCGDPVCRHTQHVRTDRRYRARHPEAAARCRLRKKLSRIRKGQAECVSAVSPPPAEMRKVPWDIVNDEIGVKVTVLLGFLTRLLLRARRDEMSAQVKALLQEFDRLQASGGNDDMACRSRLCQGPP